MNIRQRRKRARIENNWYKGKIINSWNCRYCNWDAMEDVNMKYHKILKTYYGNAEWAGYAEYDYEVKCPCCGTIFEYSDSNM